MISGARRLISRRARKRGARRAPLFVHVAERNASRRGDASWRALDLSRGETAGAHLHLHDLALRVQDASDLQIRLPGTPRGVVGVRAIVAERDALPTRIALASIDGHRSPLDQFDARHLRAVTLAVTGLQNARVSALSRCITRPDLLEELVRGLALLDVADRQAALMERPRLRLRDQLLDEGPELLRLRFRRLDRAVFDERRREIPHERELLFAGAPKLTPGLPVTHLLLLHIVRRGRSGTARRRSPIEDAHAIPALLESHAEVQVFALEQICDLLE